MPETLTPSLAAAHAADDDFEYPYEKKEIQSDKHSHIFAQFVNGLLELFKDVPDAHVGGDQAFYWTPRVIADCIVPDGHVLRGVDKSQRDSIRIFTERAAFPDFRIAFVMEIWSKDNPQSERQEKLNRYRLLGATEYLEYDAKTDALILHRLQSDGFYESVAPDTYNRLHSAELNVDFIYEDGLIRFYRDNRKIPTAAEAQAALLAKETALQAAQAEIERLKKLLSEKSS